MSFTSNKRVTNQQPCKADADMDTLIANADFLVTKSAFCCCSHSTVTSIPTGTDTEVTFPASPPVDTDSFFSFGTPTRFTIPSGVTLCRMKLFYDYSDTIMTDLYLIIKKNNSASYDGRAQVAWDKGLAGSIISPILVVVAGDYFEIEVKHANGSTVEIGIKFTIFGWRTA